MLELAQIDISQIPCLTPQFLLVTASWCRQISHPKEYQSVPSVNIFKSLSHTSLATNLNGTPWVRATSLEKWKAPMILSESSASSSSFGTSYMFCSVSKLA